VWRAFESHVFGGLEGGERATLRRLLAQVEENLLWLGEAPGGAQPGTPDSAPRVSEER
jgi:hypothetical protein